MPGYGFSGKPRERGYSPERIARMWVPLMARLGYTRHSDLKKAIQSIRLAGGNPLGVVLWDDAEPASIASAEIGARVGPPHTAEMEALAGGRAR